MPIQVACQCGQRFVAKDQLAGKQVKCPKCGNALVVPSQASEKGGAPGCLSDLLDQVGLKAGIRRCPGCGAELSEAAVLCVMCGFDTRRGLRIKTRVGTATDIDDEDLGDLPTHGHPVLDHAERQIARDKLEQSRLSAGVPWWMLFLALLGLGGFAVGMVSMPQDQVMENSGYVLMAAGTLMSAFFGLRMIIVAFKESVLQGLLYLIVPLYAVYYVFSRWDRVAGLFIFACVGTAISGVGYLMTFTLAPMFENMMRERGNKFGLRPLSAPSAIVCVTDEFPSIVLSSRAPTA